MGTIANLLIKVGVDVSEAEQDLNRFGGKTGRGLRKAFLPAVAVLGALGIAAKTGFQEFVGAQQITAQTNAALKSTGNVAHTSVGAIQDLAGALMAKSGVDDEVIQSGSNMLLTFTNIRNEVGRGNNVFDQATSTALDMSVALGQDMKGSAMQVGKALNDPIKGVTALQRVGVTFTAGQRKSIKAMVDSGNVMGAQKVILQELQKEFGGSAAAAGQTLTGQLNIARQTFNNLAGSLVGAVIPSFQTFAGVLNTVLGWMTSHQTVTKVLIGIVGGLAAAIVAANIALKIHAAYVVAASAATKVATAATKVWAAGQWLLNAALNANPLVLVIGLVAGLAAGIVIAYKNSATFRGIVQAAFNAVKVAIDAVATAVKAVVSAIIGAKDNPVVRALALPYTTQYRLIKAAIGAAEDAVLAVVGAIRTAANSSALSSLKAAWGGAWSAVKSVINSVADAISNVISKAQSAIGWIGNVASKAKSLGGGGLLGKIGVPGFAAGGIVTAPTLATVGEAGPEAIIPLNRPARAAEVMREAGLVAPASRGGGPTVHIDTMVVQDATDIDRIASRLGRQLLLAG